MGHPVGGLSVCQGAALSDQSCAHRHVDHCLSSLCDCQNMRVLRQKPPASAGVELITDDCVLKTTYER